jgi:hypothetical protein
MSVGWASVAGSRGVEGTNREMAILDMLEGQYKNPVRVVSFNTAEKWSQDVSASSPRSYVGAATFNNGMFRCSFRTSWPVMKAALPTFGCPCRCD